MRPWFGIFALLAACSSDDDARAPLESIDLRTPRGGAETRFVRLDPAESGIEFSNELRSEHIVPYIYNGGGVAVGDFDDDGLPDVYLVSQDGPNKLFRQTAPLRFEDVTAKAGGLDGGEAWGTAATFVDIDGDADLDLYVCNMEAPNLLYQNRGDGTFAEVGGRFGLAIVASSSGAAFADYDNDGDLDLYLMTNRVLGPSLPRELVADIRPPADTRVTAQELLERDLRFRLGPQEFAAGQPDRLLRNDGYAKFTDVTDRSGIRDHGMGLSATWWDYDDDGNLDLYVANDLESPDVLYRNRGDGTFEDVTESALPHTAYFGMGSDFGDIDNDGRFDFCVADMSSRTHYMSKMLMGNMGDRRWFLENARPPQYMRNAVYLNTGTGRFLEAAYLTGLASTDWTWTVRLSDLDNDGRVDLFATNGIPRFDNDPDANPEFRRLWRLGLREEALEFARNLPPVPEANLAFRNLGDYAFEEVGAEWGLDEKGVSHGAVLADLDRDGDLDAIVNNMNAPASIYENRGVDGTGLLIQLEGRDGNRHGVGARITLQHGDTTQTRLVTLARGYLGSGEPLVHFGVGEEATVDRVTVRWPRGAVQEFEGLESGKLHIVREPESAAPSRPPQPAPEPWFVAEDLPFTHAEAEFDDYALQPLLPHRLSRLGPGMAWGDVDGDGVDDLWIGGAAGQSGKLLMTTADGWSEREGPWTDDAACEDMGAVWIDFDGDADLDLFVVSGSIEHGDDTSRITDRLYRNNGGSFARVTDALPTGSARSGSCVAAADWDRDGDVDLFVGGRTVAGRFPESPASRLLRNEDGRFVDVAAEFAPELPTSLGMVTAAVWADVDDDGFVDLVVAQHWGPISLWRNDQGRGLVPSTLDLPEGLWNGITAADLDRDGDLDLVATNLGWNSKYSASVSKPMRIFADDFDDDGVLDVIEAKYFGKSLLPVRGRSCSSAAMPFVGEKFKTFDSFAKATLPEIYTPEALAKAMSRSVTSLANSILVNDGAGRFEIRELPRIAQIAPGFGVQVADFDLDGHVDIALAQNSFSSEPETGRMDGGLGLVLRGLGGLRFEPMPSRESGVRVLGDAKSLSLHDANADGRPDFAVTRNDGAALTHGNAASASGLALRLRGPAGNPAAIGARVWIVHDDGSRSTAEITAGDGYLGQRSATVFLTPVSDATELSVRWPTGETTQRELRPGDATITLESPR